MREGEIAQAFDDIWAQSSTRNWILGRLGVSDGTIAAIDVEGRPGYVVVSMGSSGDQGITIAKDKVGVARIVFQEVKMRRELGELVIREAAAYAGGTGGGSDTLAGLSDVQLTSPASGNALQYNGTKWINVVPAGGAGGAPSPHAHESSHHTGQLNWGTVSKSGSSIADLADHAHSSLDGIGPDQHHPQVHPLVGPDHTATGLTPGYSVIATTPTTFAWAQAKHTDLDPATVLPDQHHNQVHDIAGSDHFIVANTFDVVGATATNVLGLLTPTHTPGATPRILKTDAAGSLILDTTLLVVDAPNNWIGINRAASGAALDIIASANADHTQRIKQKSGQTGRMWRIEDTAGSELIVLDSVGNLQSGKPGYVSGLTGWQVTPIGNAEFNDIWARGELHASVFVKDEVHASGGTLLVTSAGKLYADAIINSATTDTSEFEVDSNAAAFPGAGLLPLTIEETSVAFTGTTLFTEGVGNSIDIEDPPSGPGFYFQPGEILRVKTEIDQDNASPSLRLSDLWLEVMSATQFTGYARYSVTKRSGTDSTIPHGTAIVSYKQRGEGLVMLTSDLQYAPYIDVFTTGNSPWAGEIVPRVRMGQLMGVGLPGVSGVSQYGIIMGSNLADANSGYIIASDQQFTLYKVPIRVNNGVADTGLWESNGNIKIGKNIGDPATTGFSIITKSDVASEEGNVIIGNVSSGHFLRWNQATSTLTVSGDLVVDMPDTGVPQSYVDSQDTYYYGQSQGYTNTQRDVAKDYSDYRRVIKVTGSWDSPAANIIRWGNSVAVQIHFGKGLPRTITSGQTTTLSARTYLFVDLAVASGNLTMIASTTATINDPNYVLVAVCDPGNPAASVTIVAGSTYISGNNIFTGSVNADRIVAGTITTDRMTVGTINGDRISIGTLAADRISTTSLSAIDTNTGSLNVTGDLVIGSAAGLRGRIYSAGKSTYTNPTSGFFLGFDVAANGFRFDIGNNINYLRWNGTDLELHTKRAVSLEAEDVDGKVLTFTSYTGGNTQHLYFDYVNGFSQLKWPGVFDTNYLNVAYGSLAFLEPLSASSTAKNVIHFRFGTTSALWSSLHYAGSTGLLTYSDGFSATTLQMRTLRAPASGAAGSPGELGWDSAYIYICVAPNSWRRVLLSTY